MELFKERFNIFKSNQKLKENKDKENRIEVKPKYEKVVYSIGTMYLNGEYTKEELKKLIEGFDKRTASLDWSMEQVDKQTK